MYTLFTNENLNKIVEDVRLSEIRQEVEAQRFAHEAKTAESEPTPAPQSRWLERLRALFNVRRWKTESPRVLRRVG